MLEVVSETGEEPLALEDALAHLRQEPGLEDELIVRKIRAIRQHFEEILDRKLVPATMRLTLDCWPRWGFNLPRGPLRIVSPATTPIVAVRYLDTNGVQQTLAATEYGWTQGEKESPRLYLRPGKSWPSLYDGPHAVIVEYTAGYASPAAIPETILEALRIELTDAYDNRGSIVVGTSSSQITRTAAALLGPHEVHGATWSADS